MPARLAALAAAALSFGGAAALPSAGGAQSTRDTLDVLRAAARAARADAPDGYRLLFEPGLSWRADRARAAALLARLALPAPGRGGAPAAGLPCGRGETGAPPIAEVGYRVALGRPRFLSARADSAVVEVGVSCSVYGPHPRGFARDDVLVLRRARPGGWWRVVARHMTRIT